MKCVGGEGWTVCERVLGVGVGVGGWVWGLGGNASRGSGQQRK